MERKPLSTGSIVGAVVLLVVVLLGLYVGGYFALGTKQMHGVMGMSRNYRHDWLACGYHPFARVEGAVTGQSVALYGPSMVYFSDGVSFATPIRH